ncbi:MAG: exodeoxyribonuclease VII small subunit [Flavobacteriales bacterium]|nr:exodeoxyribonuclease VII small subunit [Flavobacteriales bacterium]
MAKKEDLTYEAAFEELNDIVAMIEDEEVSVDQLADKMKRASFLINFCNEKLRDTEDAVNQIIRKMEDPGSPTPDEADDDAL